MCEAATSVALVAPAGLAQRLAPRRACRVVPAVAPAAGAAAAHQHDSLYRARHRDLELVVVPISKRDEKKFDANKRERRLLGRGKRSTHVRTGAKHAALAYFEEASLPHGSSWSWPTAVEAMMGPDTRITPALLHLAGQSSVAQRTRGSRLRRSEKRRRSP